VSPDDLLVRFPRQYGVLIVSNWSADFEEGRLVSGGNMLVSCCGDFLLLETEESFLILFLFAFDLFNLLSSKKLLFFEFIDFLLVLVFSPFRNLFGILALRRNDSSLGSSIPNVMGVEGFLCTLKFSVGRDFLLLYLMLLSFVQLPGLSGIDGCLLLRGIFLRRFLHFVNARSPTVLT